MSNGAYRHPSSVAYRNFTFPPASPAIQPLVDFVCTQVEPGLLIVQPSHIRLQRGCSARLVFNFL